MIYLIDYTKVRRYSCYLEGPDRSCIYHMKLFDLSESVKIANHGCRLVLTQVDGSAAVAFRDGVWDVVIAYCAFFGLTWHEPWKRILS